MLARFLSSPFCGCQFYRPLCKVHHHHRGMVMAWHGTFTLIPQVWGIPPPAGMGIIVLVSSLLQNKPCTDIYATFVAETVSALGCRYNNLMNANVKLALAVAGLVWAGVLGTVLHTNNPVYRKFNVLFMCPFAIWQTELKFFNRVTSFFHCLDV